MPGDVLSFHFRTFNFGEKFKKYVNVNNTLFIAKFQYVHTELQALVIIVLLCEHTEITCNHITSLLCDYK